MGTIYESAEEVNRMMPKVAPELASRYARYPLREKAWLSPNGKGPKGEPCFVKESDKGVVKMDYVYCKNGVNGTGYYHLLTKTSYINLYSRVVNSPPGVCGCNVSKEGRKAYEEWDVVQRVLHNRQTCSVPDDGKGAAKSLKDAQGMAVAAHAGDNPGWAPGDGKKIKI